MIFLPEELEQKVSWSNLKNVKRLLPYAGKSVAYLPVSFVLLAIMSGVEIILPQLMRIGIDGPLALHNPDSVAVRWSQVHTLGLLLLGFLGIGFVTNYLSTWLLQKFGQSLVLNLRRAIFSKLHKLPISYFDKHAVGRTVTRLVNDSNALSELFTNVLAAGIGDCILLVGILTILLFTDPVLSAILAFFCPLLVALVLWFRKKSSTLYETQRTVLAKINAYFSELLEGLATIKSFQADQFQQRRFQEMNQECLDNEFSLITLVARFRPGFAVARLAATGALLTLGGFSVLEGYSTIGTLVSSLLYINLLFSPLEQLADRYNIFVRASVASKRVITILDKDEEPRGGNSVEDTPKPISFQKVSFHYSSDKPVLKDVSFTIEPGKTVALVGPTGSGKSTIVSLLLGFYRMRKEEGHEGVITIGERPLNEVDLHHWRTKVAFVSQDLFLFKRSVSKNVKMFAPITDERVEKALEEAACSDFVEELPEGAETVVGEKGHALSTGQRQLLSFARALAFDPQFLILDEATANIDSETEAKVEQALDSLLQGRQALIVAHRLSTVRRAHKILVLSEGSIVEAGTHQELMSAGGLYARMVEKTTSAHRPAH